MNGRIPVTAETRFALKEFTSKTHCKTLNQALQLLLNKETFAEALFNQFDSITSIEMAKNIAEELFEIGRVRDTINELAQNFQDSLEAEEK